MSTVLCGLLLALTATSCFAKVHRLHRTKSKDHVNFVYLLCNLSSASAQLNVCYFLYQSFASRARRQGSDEFAQMSCEWMHMSQVATILLIGHFVFYMGYVYISCVSLKRKAALVVMCMFLECLLLEPLISGSSDRNPLKTIISLCIYFAFKFNPAITWLIIYLTQMRKGSFSPDCESVLSLIGYISQALVHTVLVTWFFVYGMSSLPSLISRPWTEYFFWYNLLGWASVDNIIFAMVQMRLFWVGWTKRYTFFAEAGHNHREERGN